MAWGARSLISTQPRDSWCGACAKCARGVLCSLSAIRDDASRIFHGVDLYGGPTDS